MEHHQHAASSRLSPDSFRSRSSKLPLHLPPTPASHSPTPGAGKFTSIERKSFVRMTSNGSVEERVSDDPFVRVHSSARRAPIERTARDLLDFGSQSHLSQLFDRLDSLSLSNLHPFGGFSTQLTSPIHSPLVGTASSGYDSNSSSSLLSGYFYPVGSSNASTIRRIPSVPNLRPSSTSSDYSQRSQPPSPQARPISSKKDRPSSLHVGKSTPKDDVIRALDKIEKRVAFLREVAQELLTERVKLDGALRQINQHCDESHFSEVDLEDITIASKALRKRLDAVNIEVRTQRSIEQTKALEKANQYVNELRGQVSKHVAQHPAKTEPQKWKAAKQRCLSYISSCSSDGIPEIPATPIDEKFQRTVIECAAEDQKQIRRTLEAILSQLANSDKP